MLDPSACSTSSSSSTSSSLPVELPLPLPSLKKQKTELDFNSLHDPTDSSSSSSSLTSPSTYRARLRNAAQLVLITSSSLTRPHPFLSGSAQSAALELLSGPCGLIIGHDGLIVAIGAEAELVRKFDEEKGEGGQPNTSYDVDIDCRGCSIIPGLVDGHTHPIWSGDRVDEFSMKLAGATYMDIHNKGGGIGFSVKETAKASDELLIQLLMERMSRALKLGTTTMEAKSGYGLSLDSELRLLRLLHQASQLHQGVTLITNYCGAHSIPSGSSAEAATEDIINRQIPAVAEALQKNEISCSLIDVFCEKGVFNREQTRSILETGKKLANLQGNFHGDELSYQGSGELAGEIGAVAVSHLEHVSEAGCAAMAKSGSVAVLLPTTAYLLRIPPPPARTLISANVPVALGSDFNPNAHCLSLPLVMHLACVNLKMTMEEALIAATINAAASLGEGRKRGSLEVGKVGDVLVLKSDKWEKLVYEMVDPPIWHVIKEGKVVYTNHEVGERTAY